MATLRKGAYYYNAALSRNLVQTSIPCCEHFNVWSLNVSRANNKLQLLLRLKAIEISSLILPGGHLYYKHQVLDAMLCHQTLKNVNETDKHVYIRSSPLLSVPPVVNYATRWACPALTFPAFTFLPYRRVARHMFLRFLASPLDFRGIRGTPRFRSQCANLRTSAALKTEVSSSRPVMIASTSSSVSAECCFLTW